MDERTSSATVLISECSVIIPSYNSQRTLAWCLEGLMEQDRASDLDVIVVESGDADYLFDLSRRWPQVKFVISPERLYSGQARNVAAKIARGATLLFLDSDCRPCPGWLPAMLEPYTRGYEAVCGSLDNGSPESLGGTAEYIVSHSTYSPALPPRDISKATAASGNLSVTKKTFEAIGGFGGTFRANDFFFTLKLQSSGARIVFWPAARVLCVNCEGTREFLAGQLTRGSWSGAARLESGSQGSVVKKFPPLAFLLFPLRLYRLVSRCIRYRTVPGGKLLMTLPVASLGLMAWTWGFFKASLGIKKVGLEERTALPGGWEDFEILAGGTKLKRSGESK